MKDLKRMLDDLAKYGGRIVSTASLDPDQIAQARASGRMYVDEKTFYGFVWEPPIMRIPQTTREVKLWEKWFPLEVELPESLKTVDWLFEKRADEIKVYGQCPHGENMVKCSECNPNQ